MSFFDELFKVLVELAPWLLLGATVAGALHVLLPVDFVRTRLRGRSGVLKAVLLGVPLPLCSCGVIPAGLGLKKDGASNGAAIAFLVSTPQTGVDSILVSASFFGWPFALFKVASAFVLGLVGGLATDLVEPGETELDAAAVKRAKPTWRDGIAHALEMIRTIWKWLVFGVVASAAISTFVPAGAFVELSAYGGLVAMAAMLAVSLPLYVCATASVPIAAALVAGGFPPGAALVFLMAGPATNLATVGAVRRAFGTRTLLVYLTTIALGSIALGWAFDFVLVGELGVAASLHSHGTPNPLELAAAIALIALIGWFAVDDARRFVKERSQRSEVEHLEVDVDGMSCMGCVRKLTSALESAEGVTSATVVLEPRGHVTVEGTLAADQLHAAIRTAGFEPV